MTFFEKLVLTHLPTFWPGVGNFSFWNPLVPGILLYDIIIFLRALLTNFFSHAGPSENVACGFNSTSMQKKRDEGDVYYYRDTLHTKVHGPEVVAHV